MSKKDPSLAEETSTLVARFVALANEMKDEEKPIEMINTALQMASGTYSTYITAGNNGYLRKSGIDKLTSMYRHNLVHLQNVKKAQLNLEGKD